ncbi:Serine/threonine-protein phosphatase 7 long form-like protein [Senna tora]|uniref:Serine/threonine-protein phosphatase 7 long form-like protein n=1 Tax=Senna tora TaxID=362788 RepID=A0A834SCL2_9FABA|nr:Serine/threonine-protein phosphatase 7 long form-like protein [Senna tora]
MRWIGESVENHLCVAFVEIQAIIARLVQNVNVNLVVLEAYAILRHVYLYEMLPHIMDRGHATDPGPEDPSLLYLQTRHSSQFIWAGYATFVNFCTCGEVATGDLHFSHYTGRVHYYSGGCGHPLLPDPKKNTNHRRRRRRRKALTKDDLIQIEAKVNNRDLSHHQLASRPYWLKETRGMGRMQGLTKKEKKI